MVQWLRLHAPNAGGLSSNLGQGARSSMPQLKIPRAATKTWCSCINICMRAQLCLTLCDPMNCNLPCSSVRGILQPRILEWVAMPSSRGSPDPGIEPASLMSPALAGRFFTTLPPGKPRVYICIHLNVTESLCYSPETQRSTILQ